MKRVDVASTFILDESRTKVLIVKNVRGESFDYSLPGGAVEVGETLAEAAIRETKEESGYDVRVNGVLSIHEAFFQEKNHHVVFFTFTAEVSGGAIEISQPDEILDVRWVTIEEAHSMLIDRQIDIKKYAHQQGRAEHVIRNQLKIDKNG
ncbi:NUDIX hydrolase [Bacillus sp. 2205SS5-2]|uniref:NUDIX hydrolase n=1 Tax=Bacillus sp. 2205SS5-2 TaxID=3109031 RepID=UPI00300572EE